MLHKISRMEGTGAAGGLVAAILATFDKVSIMSGIEIVDQICSLE